MAPRVMLDMDTANHYFTPILCNKVTDKVAFFVAGAPNPPIFNLIPGFPGIKVKRVLL
jgi:hypothetical protein